MFARNRPSRGWYMRYSASNASRFLAPTRASNSLSSGAPVRAAPVHGRFRLADQLTCGLSPRSLGVSWRREGSCRRAIVVYALFFRRRNLLPFLRRQRRAAFAAPVAPLLAQGLRDHRRTSGHWRPGTSTRNSNKSPIRGSLAIASADSIWRAVVA